MAVKAKKRKLSVVARKTRDGTAAQADSSAEAELQRQEEEMLAATRLLKQVDNTEEALTVAKQILQSTVILEATAAAATPTIAALDDDDDQKCGAAQNGLAARSNRSPSKAKTSQTPDRALAKQPAAQKTRISSRQRQAVATNVTPPSTRGTRSRAAMADSSSSATIGAETVTNGIATENRLSTSSETQDGSTWLADLTVANIQKQNDAHKQEQRRLQETRDTDNATGSGSAEVNGAATKVAATAKDATLNGASKQEGMSVDTGRAAPSVISETSIPYVASIISGPNPTVPISATISPRGDGEHESTTSSSDQLGFDVPIEALGQPRLTKNLIQQKARSTYAPSASVVAEQPPRRRPGRPPGYFLGPTSCAYCRTQHRRCDFNTVCIRCIKAKIPCDRSGTVDRPTIIVREARQQAKAEAAAALAAAVAAGLAVIPEKPRPVVRQTQLDALTQGVATRAGNSTSTPSESSVTGAGGKRRRSLSPSDVSPENIIERRAKRAAAVTPIKKYDPSMYMKHVRGSQNGRKPASQSVNEETSAGSPSGSTSSIGLADSKRLRARSGVRETSPSSPSSQPATNRMIKAMKRAMDSTQSPSLKEKSVQGQSRLAKELSSSDPAIVPAKRSRGPLNKLTSFIKDGKGKQVAGDTPDEEEEDSGSNKEEPRKRAVPLVRKAYLKSGLYSADLKVNPVNNLKLTLTLKQASKETSKQRPQPSKAVVPLSRRGGRVSAGNPSQSGSFFQLPINYGSVLISKQKDFCLPYDIMQAWQAGLLRKAIQPEPFVKIRSNIFVERKRRTETSPMVCHCIPPPSGAGRVGCGEDCYNRVMFYECISAHCPCGDQCSNQRFQKKHDESNLRVIWTQERGFGVKTLEPIKKGSLVIEYRGEVISQSECHHRMETIYKDNKNFYFLEYEKGEVVDACQKGTNARFVNHSCSPNSQIEKWFLSGEMSIGIFASQDIPAGTEISYDYNFSSFSGAQKQKCRCGSLNCRGYIGERISKSKDQLMNGAAAGGVGSATISGSHKSLGRSGKKGNAKKRKTGRGKVNDQEPNSIRLTQMPSVRQIRQRQSDKYKEGKMAAIRYTRLFLFRNIRLVESKYIKYAQTKSRSYQAESNGRASKSRRIQARQSRKRSLEGVVEDLRAAEEQRERERVETSSNSNCVAEQVDDDDDSDLSLSAAAEESSIVLELDVDDEDAMIEYDVVAEEEEEIDELEEEGREERDEDEIDELEDEDVELAEEEEQEVDELESDSDA